MSDVPLVIAHRGASGYLPEHTLEAKALAYGQGADYLEQDVVATRDGALLVLHDPYLEAISDVAQRFRGRHREDGHYYVIDFELAEVRQLTVHERRAASAATQPALRPTASRFRVATLEEELEMVARLNERTGRKVGVYPEIKHPRWHRDHGIDLARLLLAELERFGYRRESDPAFVQCFDAGELRRVREELGSRLRLVQLVEDSPEYRELLTPEGLGQVADYAQGLGPACAQLVCTSDPAGTGWSQSRLTRDARQAGLLLHPYTFRRSGLPPYAASLEQLLEIFLGEVSVDGVFCDYPDIAVRVRAALTDRLSPPSG